MRSWASWLRLLHISSLRRSILRFVSSPEDSPCSTENLEYFLCSSQHFWRWAWCWIWSVCLVQRSRNSTQSSCLVQTYVDTQRLSMEVNSRPSKFCFLTIKLHCQTGVHSKISRQLRLHDDPKTVLVLSRFDSGCAGNVSASVRQCWGFRRSLYGCGCRLGFARYGCQVRADHYTCMSMFIVSTSDLNVKCWIIEEQLVFVRIDTCGGLQPKCAFHTWHLWV